MIFSGARRAGFPNAGGSPSSIAPTMRRFSSFECIRSFSATRGFQTSCTTRRQFGRSGIVPSWTWRSTFTVTAPGSSSSFSTCRRTSNESASSISLMSRTRTGNSASRTFTRGNTGNATRSAFAACLNATSTHHAPWYVVPADDKENARLIVSQILLDTLNELKMAYPKSTAKRRQELKSIRRLLAK